jgi:hypothetical protein
MTFVIIFSGNGAMSEAGGAESEGNGLVSPKLDEIG